MTNNTNKSYERYIVSDFLNILLYIIIAICSYFMLIYVKNQLDVCMLLNFIRFYFYFGTLCAIYFLLNKLFHVLCTRLYLFHFVAL